MRESWTDDPLDDLNGKVDSLRVETRTEFKAVRGEMKNEFAAVRGEMKEEFAAVRTEMWDGFAKMDERFDQMYCVLIGFCGLMFATVVSLMAAQI